MNPEEPRGLRRGRSARRASRLAPGPEVNPAPPGQLGGAYRPLSEAGMQAIWQTALRLLGELGLGDAPGPLVAAATARGARVNAAGRLIFPQGLVEEIVAGACKGFVLHGRDARHDIEIGGERVFFGTGGAAVQTLDLETGRYRPSTLADLRDFTRLADQLENISWFTRCCIATDIEDPFELDVATAHALVCNTLKPVGTAFTLAGHVDPVIDMFDTVMGGPGAFAARPCLQVHISPVISPLRFGEDAFAVTLACIRRGVPINAIIAAQSGATAPATPAGFLAQSLAETLAALAMVNLFAPGHPVIFSNWPLVIDLRSGAFAGGGGEISVMNAASGQLSNWLGLPSGAAASMSDAKAPDAQMGAEKALSAVLAGLAGTNMVFESAGMMASLLGASAEAFVLDDEMLGHVLRAIRGIEFDDEALGYDAVVAAINGEGHFLGSPHTMAAMQRDYFHPALADRDPPAAWEERGAPEIRAAARARARQILSAQKPACVPPETERNILSQFPFLAPG